MVSSEVVALVVVLVPDSVVGSAVVSVSVLVVASVPVSVVVFSVVVVVSAVDLVSTVVSSAVSTGVSVWAGAGAEVFVPRRLETKSGAKMKMALAVKRRRMAIVRIMTRAGEDFFLTLEPNSTG